MKQHKWNSIYLLLMMTLWPSAQSLALTVNFELENQNREKMKDFVLALELKDKTVNLNPKSPAKNYEMIQKDKSFVPRVLAIQKGSKVVFPNKDDTSHSIYSFSEAKKFNVELYKSTDKVPELDFSEEGVIVLGCNIHDWMLGVIVVTDSPHVAYTSRQSVTLNDLSAGTYNVKLWHKDLGVEKLVTLPKALEIQNEHHNKTIKLSVDAKNEEAW